MENITSLDTENPAEATQQILLFKFNMRMSIRIRKLS
jgi:hypothetical protein